MDCPDDVYEGDDWGKQIKCLKIEIEGLRKEIENTTVSAGKMSSKLGDTWNVLKDMKVTIVSMRDEMMKFVQSAEQQYKLGEAIAKGYKDTAISIGLSTKRSAALSQEFKGALTEISKFGGDISDAERIYKEFADSSGRVRILGDEEVSNIFKLEKATNLYGDQATSLYETLDLMGVSNEEATKRMVELVTESQAIGLNSSKVSKMMAANMKSMQSYSFRGGVRGMTEMAKQAVKMRIDVGDVLQMADKFYQPEAALEAAANLQMLGGDIAKAFGDPFETMYLARNKPEELAKRLQDMTENMLQFNEVSGEYELPAEARMQLKSAGEQLGINTEKMVEMARQSSKMKDIKSQLSGSIFSEDEMEGISSLARMEDGEFKVDFRDKNGEKVTKSIDELTSGQAKMLLEAPENEVEYMDEMLYQSQRTNETLDNMYKSFEFGFVQDIDYYKAIETSTKESIKQLDDLGVSIKKLGKDGLKDTWVSGKGDEFQDKQKKLDEAMASQIKSITGIVDTLSINPTDGSKITFGGDNKLIFKNALGEDTTEVDVAGDTSGVGNNKATVNQTTSTIKMEPLEINFNIKGDTHLRDVATKELMENIALKAVMQIKENSGVPTGKEAVDLLNIMKITSV